MSRFIVISLVLMIGLGIGSIVPAATSWWYDVEHADKALKALRPETVSANEISAKSTYHFELEQGVLSVSEGDPGTKGRVVLTGLNVQTWPKELLDIAPKIKFNSLDEVQSFIDTSSELLW